MKTILVTGANGQLGHSLQRLSESLPAYQFLFTDIDTLDICDKESILAFAEGKNIHYIINCAAYTAVDKAEDDEIICMRINSEAVRNLGEAATTLGAKIIHISTDYVFDGTNSVPYLETDYTCPMSAYGRSKQTGELILRAVCPDAIIIRTAWLYSECGNNFLSTMLCLGKEKEELNVVFDQIGTPTYAGDLANAIISIIDSIEAGTFKSGIYHFSNEGVCSWYDFARKIFEIAGIKCRVIPIDAKDYPTRATRPQYSVLNKGKIKRTYGLAIPHWEESLRKMLKKTKK
ncbi:NAD(P)-dependent oxidoreductase [Bacteroidia bacterium]|nr:NAD(P)-dependent oxidoreductase [Bacteroidia bacterium]GHU75629.1 NAD(P)-dependent oxidoreductase [Bacteroidia bacterium]